MKTMCMVVAWATVFVPIGTSTGVAAPPLMNYQGRLTNGSGQVVSDGNYSVRFTLYDAATIGTVLWAETLSVNVASGLFTVEFGHVHPLSASLFSVSDRWLGVAVGLDPELTPRTRLTSVAYAFATANGGIAFLPLTGGTMSGAISSTGDPAITMGKGNFGSGNTNAGLQAFVAGGDNSASMSYSVVSGGRNNESSNPYAAVGGGSDNAASGSNSVVAGGLYNVASGTNSTVAGGNRDTASGVSATAIGGYHNIASGEFSLAAGYRARADYIGSFVWADYNAADQSAGGPNRFVVRATNGAFFPAGRLNVGDAAGNATTISKGDYRQDNSIVAWGKVTGSTGFVSTNEYGVSNVVRNSAGNYTVTLDISADATANLIPMAIAEIDVAPNSAATARIVSINQVTVNSFDVYILNGNWVATDNDFTLMVTAR